MEEVLRGEIVALDKMDSYAKILTPFGLYTFKFAGTIPTEVFEDSLLGYTNYDSSFRIKFLVKITAKKPNKDKDYQYYVTSAEEISSLDPIYRLDECRQITDYKALGVTYPTEEEFAWLYKFFGTYFNSADIRLPFFCLWENNTIQCEWYQKDYTTVILGEINYKEKTFEGYLWNKETEGTENLYYDLTDKENIKSFLSLLQKTKPANENIKKEEIKENKSETK